jgi:hypothetical protein
VAVLHLEDDGQELPAEFQLAGWDEIEDLWAKPVGMIGFPGHDTHFPKKGGKVRASAREGIVSWLADFNLDPNAPDHQLQLVQYTQSSWGGFSGSPVFLPNGRVVALHNSARYDATELEKRDGGKALLIRDLATGVRVDVLWELLEHHGLAQQVGGYKVRWGGQGPSDTSGPQQRR